jgi:hypothetical protein
VSIALVPGSWIFAFARPSLVGGDGGAHPRDRLAGAVSEELREVQTHDRVSFDLPDGHYDIGDVI